MKFTKFLSAFLSLFFILIGVEKAFGMESVPDKCEICHKGECNFLVWDDRYFVRLRKVCGWNCARHHINACEIEFRSYYHYFPERAFEIKGQCCICKKSLPKGYGDLFCSTCEPKKPVFSCKTCEAKLPKIYFETDPSFNTDPKSSTCVFCRTELSETDFGSNSCCAICNSKLSDGGGAIRACGCVMCTICRCKVSFDEFSDKYVKEKRLFDQCPSCKLSEAGDLKFVMGFYVVKNTQDNLTFFSNQIHTSSRAKDLRKFFREGECFGGIDPIGVIFQFSGRGQYHRWGKHIGVDGKRALLAGHFASSRWECNYDGFAEEIIEEQLKKPNFRYFECLLYGPRRLYVLFDGHEF